MKAPALLFLTIASVALLCPTAHATTINDSSPRQKATPTVPQPRHGLRANKLKHESVPLPTPATPHRATNTPKRPASGKTINAHPPLSGPRSNPTNTGLRASRNTNQPRPLKPSTLARHTASTPNDARHHGANPAAIGGPRNATVASTAALGGRALSRRP